MISFRRTALPLVSILLVTNLLVGCDDEQRRAADAAAAAMRKWTAAGAPSAAGPAAPTSTAPVTTAAAPTTTTTRPAPTTTRPAPTTTRPAPTTTAPAPPAPPSGRWMPTADRPLTLHWVLDGALNLNDPVQMGLRDFAGNPLPEPDVYDIDGEYNSAATVAALQARGKKVICYFDAGVYETYRSDAHKFPSSVIGNVDVGWDGSYWLDVRRIDVLEPIMRARMQMCKDKGFDAIEPDEIDGYSNDPGFPLTYEDQLRYNKALARWAHEIGMSIGLKGDIDQAADLADDFDWTLNEECYEFNECTPALRSFTQRNKAVWIAEYKNYTATKWASICANSRAEGFNTARYKLGLPRNGGRMPC